MEGASSMLQPVRRLPVRRLPLPGRGLLRFALVAFALVAAAGCASAGSTPGWTFAPTLAPSPAGSPGGSVAPSASAAPASTAPSSPASPAPSAAASAGSGGSGGTATITITAQNIAFTQTTVEAPANQPWTLVFDNQDAGVPHNVDILGANGQPLFKTDIFNGVDKRSFSVPALPAGTYKFICDVHPTVMIGTLTVK
jgi:plastocyanin